ncbi:oxygenase MpaB family protein [Enterobacterales bacterium BD_CKDN230030183-1A_HGKHYDSX7]
MEAIRRRIETQVMSLTGLALGQLDLESPKGDPGLFGPQSMSWRVHGDFPSMLIGGIAALLLQLLHPAALAGVWDHSNFRGDLLGRLRRTSQFISGTTFGSTRDAEWLIAKVRDIHLKVTGNTPDGQPYAASDPDLLTWVHVAEVSCFLAAHLRYRDPHLPRTEQDRYYDEIALIAERLGARNVPRCCQQVDDYLRAMRPDLKCGARSQEVVAILLAAPAPSRLAQPVGKLMLQAGIDLLPEWAVEMLALQQGPLHRQLVRQGVLRTAPVLRWAMRNGSAQRAKRRMGLE